MIKQLSQEKRAIVTAVLLIASFLALTSQTMMVTALPVIQQELHVSLTQVQWLTTGYILIIGIITPLSSNLYEKFTNRQLFLTTTGLFIVGTFLGSISQSFATLLLARILQAIAGGIIMSFQMTALVVIFPPEKRGTILGMSGLVVASGPALGPTIAGIILHFFNWHYLFILVLPLFIILWFIGLIGFPNFSQPQVLKIDIGSVFLLLIGSSLALSSLTLFKQNILTGMIALLVGLTLLYIFGHRQLHLKQPLLRIQIAKLPSFSLMTIVGMLAFMVLIGTEQIIPIFVEKVVGLNSMQAGLILLPGALANAIFAAWAGRYYDAHGAKLLILCGISLMIIAAIPLLFMTKAMPIWLIVVAYMIRMIGNSCVFSPAMSEAFIDITPTEISHATALNNAIRQVAGSVSTTLMVVLADIPASLTQGVHWAILFTFVLLGLMILFFRYYLKQKTV
ncbi:MAG: MFS transporter [Liquorilactobacillus nagelii]|jgi:DHA2 family multidrug resistance protein-like MFS transporter|uniref:MFS transporter n=1 Tax=Liquorilactobacillus nagelii TaxID=82688 RepID=UPI00242A3988|nr:MFS transporter [Liquorilactobacillus nagelii]MCI1922502.1 MFS transporter [Liquorilactobacillus nagelii]MCI1977021.1 MFS transporter [Liquorilactobacillus nagelii]